jgi:alpha-mannosidase
MWALTLAACAAAALAQPHRAPYNTSATRKEGAINVHLVPHTHNDVGWLKNVDEYYVGARQDIQKAAVQDIINSVIHALAWNPDRKFIYVEQAFFQRFWDDTDTRTAELVRQLVASGQLEFVNAGMSMHDEANPTYIDMIDQTTLGHRLIKAQFGVVPTSTWQIDVSRKGSAPILPPTPLFGRGKLCHPQ